MAVLIPERAFFVWEQRKLLQMAATRYGRDLLCITDMGEAPSLILPSAVQWKESSKTFLTEFRTHNKYAKVIRHRWKEYREYADWLEAQEWRCYQKAHAARWGYYAVAGATDSDFFPDPDPETTSVDGEAEATGTNVTFTTLVGGAGNSATSNAATEEIQIGADTTTDRYNRLRRLIFLFDTSAITDSDSIDAATLSLNSSDLRDNLSIGAGDNSRMVVTDSAPATDTDLVAGDYDSLGSTSFGESDIQDNWTNGVYEVITLNASGEANISKTGVSKFGTKYKHDFGDDTTGITWGSGAESRIQIKMAETAGTASDPKLAVTHTAAGGRIMGPLAALGGLAGHGGIAGRGGGIAG